MAQTTIMETPPFSMLPPFATTFIYYFISFFPTCLPTAIAHLQELE
jgi:hypothetical protein